MSGFAFFYSTVKNFIRTDKEVKSSPFGNNFYVGKNWTFQVPMGNEV